MTKHYIEMQCVMVLRKSKPVRKYCIDRTETGSLSSITPKLRFKYYLKPKYFWNITRVYQEEIHLFGPFICTGRLNASSSYQAFSQSVSQSVSQSNLLLLSTPQCTVYVAGSDNLQMTLHPCLNQACRYDLTTIKNRYRLAHRVGNVLFKVKGIGLV